MTITGPAHLAGTDNLDCRTRMYFQSFKDSVARGLESIQVRLWRTQNNYSPNMLTNATFVLDPFASTTSQRWQAVGQYLGAAYKWSWTTTQVNVGIGGGAGNTYGEWGTIYPGMRTPVYGQDGNPLQLEIGWNGELVFGIAAGANAGTKTFQIRASNADNTESFSTTVNIASGAALANYTLTFTTTVAWRGVYIEILSTAGNVSVANPSLIKSVSFRYRVPTLNGLVKLHLHQDLNGRPGARIASANTTKNLNSDLTGSAANYLFTFSTPVFLQADTLYHFSVSMDSTELFNWTVGTGADNIVYLVGDLTSTTYPDGQLTQYLFGTGWNTALGANGDLYFQINYSDVVPEPSYLPIVSKWDCDCAVQYGRIATLVANAESLIDVRGSGLNRERIEIASASEPGTGRWQSEWLLRGNSLPIPDGTQLLWFNTATNAFGGEWFQNGLVVTRLESGGLINNTLMIANSDSGSFIDPNLVTGSGATANPTTWRGWANVGTVVSEGAAVDVTVKNKYRCKVLLTIRVTAFSAGTLKFQVFVDGIPEGFEEGGGSNATLDGAIVAATVPGAGNFQEYTINWVVRDTLEPGTHHITLAAYGAGQIFWGYPVVGGGADKFSLTEVIRVP